MASDMPQRVAEIVAEALNVPIDRVTASASLIDDLGAESIDFLDILFRVETAFGIKFRENELWGGTNDRSTHEATPTPAELGRLITVQTIIDHLRLRGIS
jgi:acyl carrier protein